ncbi:hypothetical protein H6G89_22230 [Oscillatoria sp. FACHB-1407]|nr:hypothetical protein [Oscillatoria sp. FACHB-1407]
MAHNVLGMPNVVNPQEPRGWLEQGSEVESLARGCASTSPLSQLSRQSLS